MRYHLYEHFSDYIVDIQKEELALLLKKYTIDPLKQMFESLHWIEFDSKEPTDEEVKKLSKYADRLASLNGIGWYHLLRCAQE